MIQIKGKVIDVLPVRSGIGKSGRSWQEQQVVINHIDGQWPKNMCVQFKGNQVDVVGALNRGDIVQCDIAIDAREWQGKWFNEIVGYNLTKE